MKLSVLLFALALLCFAADPPTWEYCTVEWSLGTVQGGTARATARIRYPTQDGYREELVEVSRTVATQNLDVEVIQAGRLAEHKAMWKLGREGWELVTVQVVSGDSQKRLYFKRAINRK